MSRGFSFSYYKRDSVLRLSTSLAKSNQFLIKTHSLAPPGEHLRFFCCAVFADKLRFRYRGPSDSYSSRLCWTRQMMTQHKHNNNLLIVDILTPRTPHTRKTTHTAKQGNSVYFTHHSAHITQHTHHITSHHITSHHTTNMLPTQSCQLSTAGRLPTMAVTGHREKCSILEREPREWLPLPRKAAGAHIALTDGGLCASFSVPRCVVLQHLNLLNANLASASPLTKTYHPLFPLEGTNPTAQGHVCLPPPSSRFSSPPLPSCVPHPRHAS